MWKGKPECFQELAIIQDGIGGTFGRQGIIKGGDRQQAALGAAGLLDRLGETPPTRLAASGDLIDPRLSLQINITGQDPVDKLGADLG